MEMEARGQNEKCRKESAGLGRQSKMEKKVGIQDGSKASGWGVGLLDLANKNAFNIWDILILKNDSLAEIQIQLRILYLILQTYLGGWVNSTAFIQLGMGGGTVVGEEAKRMMSLLLLILSLKYLRDIADFQLSPNAFLLFCKNSFSWHMATQLKSLLPRSFCRKWPCDQPLNNGM